MDGIGAAGNRRRDEWLEWFEVALLAWGFADGRPASSASWHATRCDRTVLYTATVASFRAQRDKFAGCAGRISAAGDDSAADGHPGGNLLARLRDLYQ